MRRYVPLIAAACLAVLTGCARTSVTTEVKPDGSWTRTGVFRGQPKEQPGKNGGMNMGMALRDAFQLPAGPEWSVKITKEDEDSVYTATRSLKPGETLKGDIIVKKMGNGPDANKPSLQNEVTVREVAPGKLEYREVLRWQGERPAELTKPDPELTGVIQRAMPAEFAKPEDSELTAQVLQRELWRMLFGPGDPMISQLISFPDLLERRFKRRVGEAVNKTLLERYGDRMTAEQRTGVVRKLVADATSKTFNKQKEMKSGMNGPGDAGGGLVALTFTARLPGKITATNGEIDEAAGEVYWAMYAEAAALEDITLTATCEVNKSARR